MCGRDVLESSPQQRRVLQPALCVPGASWWQRTGYRTLSGCWGDDQVDQISIILKLILFSVHKREGATMRCRAHYWKIRGR